MSTPERHKSLTGEVGRFFKDLNVAPDRGRSFYQHERQRQHLASLVDAGRHAGRSRVEYAGRNITYHLFTKDFFITAINQKTTTIALAVSAVYLFAFLFFSIWWYLIVRFYPGCLYGATTYVEAFVFSVVTHMTIGYGNTGPQSCWAAAWLIAVQIIFALMLEAIVIGIVFARISHPKQRSRSIFISDSAIIARRDGILKFMFRVADIRRTQVVDPKIKAFMYTWGDGRVTAEGEKIPVRCEPLDLGYIDGMLLLPLIIEHTIDERSPLCGHTHDSLMALNSEVVVTFEGTTEFGNPFMARRSYLPTEVHWGHRFAEIIMKPEGEESRYFIDLNKFHDVLPQDGLPLLPPSQLSQLVVNRAKRTGELPYPLLGENTLVLSDLLCVGPNEDGRPCLMVADTYPNQMLEITVRMYLYRWHQPTDGHPAFQQFHLECGYETGEDRLYLRLPIEVCHPITEDSPIAGWLKPGGLIEDADSEIVVVINAYLHVNGQNRLRQRTYTVHNHVRYGYHFQNIVKHPAEDRKPRVRWAHFHDIQPVEDLRDEMMAREDIGLAPVPSQPNLAAVYARLPSIAPESHGALRSVETRRHMFRQSSTGVIEAAAAARRSSGGGGQPPAGGLPPRVPMGRLGAPAAAAAAQPAYKPTVEEERNDYTGDTIPLNFGPAPRRSALPTEFARQLAAANQHQVDVEEGQSPPFVLFPEVQTLNYALNTTDAGDSLPHAQALHPTLPGPDRFRVDENEERNDYTVLPMDLSRYMTQMAASHNATSPHGSFGAAAGAALSEALRRQQQQQQQPARSAAALPVLRADGAPPLLATVAESSSGYATPTSGVATTPPAPPAASQQGSDGGTPAEAAVGAGATAAAAALAAGRPDGGKQPQQPQELQQQAADQAAASSSGADGSEVSDGRQSLPEQQQQHQDEEEKQHAEEVAQQLQQRLEPQMQERLSRTPSTWALAEEKQGQEEEEGAGPIHFTKQESWQRERALKNLFAAPDNPSADAEAQPSGSKADSPAGQSG
ncbi:hypothetical protein CHLNCDRAFT_133057 [Chlorella variabilis]|uniref:Uncharacterized protein n=1 Tax=Chlorella variabilis TaxID=554065 RepID=E1Z293_CHLVA|nr:hypothetical protein CHLNCDRAFT_133057 [Chlorella variabilis]EFN59959.1 hypothetical protein CHLNCDRAFT_133057 [Chlorella variabilis]|eukprot:XP_005852061.1 hypothetical protein CHLNCDRAFT_133057 [Chlorella variabilis]